MDLREAAELLGTSTEALGKRTARGWPHSDRRDCRVPRCGWTRVGLRVGVRLEDRLKGDDIVHLVREPRYGSDGVTEPRWRRWLG